MTSGFANGKGWRCCSINGKLPKAPKYSVAMLLLLMTGSAMFVVTVSPAISQTKIVLRLEDCNAVALAQGRDGDWFVVGHEFVDNTRHSVTRVDLEYDGRTCENLQAILPLIKQLPYLKEIHIPAWMSDNLIRTYIDIEQLRGLKIVYDAPFPA